ncbi:MAG: hypothetical protein ACI8RD_013003 [Bacillariaceae sp.]|jgi:hypothetical protein
MDLRSLLLLGIDIVRILLLSIDLVRMQRRNYMIALLLIISFFVVVVVLATGILVQTKSPSAFAPLHRTTNLHVVV